jgi:GNAT superfamily N-acetyltransferase
MSSFDFQPLTRADLPLLHRWLNEPHVARWFGGRSLADIEDEYGGYIDGKEPIYPFLAVLDGRAIGMMNWEHFGDYPAMAALYGVTDPDATNCDVLIGERELAHRGLGPAMVRAFLEQVVFAQPRPTCSIIDPHTENASAIRAYEKAGYRFLRVAPDDGDGKAVYLMELRRQDLGRGPEAGAYIRPARSTELTIASEIDDDATEAYAKIGISVWLPHDHPFAEDEEARWAAAQADGHLLFACAADGTPVGFAAFGLVDGRPYLHQISVRCSAARQGVGTLLMERVKRWSLAAGELWLTTYGHVAFNRPWYERIGFGCVDAALAGPELAAIVAKEAAALPDASARVLMRYVHTGTRDACVGSSDRWRRRCRTAACAQPGPHVAQHDDEEGEHAEYADPLTDRHGSDHHQRPRIEHRPRGEGDRYQPHHTRSQDQPAIVE